MPRNPIGNSRDQLRQVQRRIGVMPPAGQQDLPVQTVHLALRWPGDVPRQQGSVLGTIRSHEAPPPRTLGSGRFARRVVLSSTSQHGATNSSSQASRVTLTANRTKAAQSRIRKELAALTKILYVGLDVHAETIAVAVAKQDGEVRSHDVIPNRVEAIRKLIGKLGPAARLRVCYKAGPAGYALYWQLAALGVACEVSRPA
jgi:hypothetical protein